MFGLLLGLNPCLDFFLESSHVRTPPWPLAMPGLFLGLQPCQDSSLTPSHARMSPWLLDLTPPCTPDLSELLLRLHQCLDYSHVWTSLWSPAMFGHLLWHQPYFVSYFGHQPCLHSSLESLGFQRYCFGLQPCLDTPLDSPSILVMCTFFANYKCLKQK